MYSPLYRAPAFFPRLAFPGHSFLLLGSVGSGSLRSPVSVAFHVALVLLVVASFTAYSASLRDVPSCTVNLVFERPVSNDSWLVRVSVEGLGSCEGVVAANPFFIQTKGVSRALLVLPLYYVFDSACSWGSLVYERLVGVGDNITFCVSVVDGYGVLTGLDGRGYGCCGRYRLPGGVFARFYLHDGIVVYNASIYRVLSDGVHRVVYGGGVGVEEARVALGVLRVVDSELRRWLGASPRSPVVLVLVGPGVHPLYPPGFAHSMGGVVYVKLGYEGLGWLVHTVAHEAVHGWFNYGLLNGDFALREGGVEFLALHALEGNRTLYELARGYIGSSFEGGGGYTAWAFFHRELWEAGLRACGVDVYMAGLRVLFERAVEEAGFYATLFDLVRVMVASAPVSCKCRLVEELGVLARAAGVAGVCEGGGVASGSGATVTVTETRVYTVVRTVVHTTTATVTAAGGVSTSAWLVALLLVVPLALLALRRR